jgi:CRP/FNR family cyclic AMP-dependent transcriptional regulator
MKINLFNKDADAERHAAGTCLFQAGDPGHEMFVVIEGTVDLLVHDKVVETVETGGAFGEMALVEKLPRVATAVVTSDAKVVRIDERRFLFLVQQNPFFSLQIMAVMAERLRRMNEKL